MERTKRKYTKEELERAIREARTQAEFPQHRAHGMYGGPALDRKTVEVRNKKPS